MIMLAQRTAETITSNDFHSIASICAIVFFITSVAGVFGRIFTKIVVVHTLKWDDYSILVGLVSSDFV